MSYVLHDRSHMTPLMVASQHGHVRVVEKLLSCGAEVNNVDNRRWPALFYAAEGGHTRVVELLLANRADATKCSNDGTAADIAYSKDHLKLSELLEAAANPAKSKTANGTTSALPPSNPIRAGGDISPSTPATTTTAPTTNSITNHQPPPPSKASTMSNHQPYHVLDDLELFLYGLKLGDLIPLFKDHEVTFPQLLQISEEDLEKIGVSQVGNRKRIVESIHAIHRKKWEPNSIRKPSLVLSLPETHLILDNVNKHVAYIKSSIVHIRDNLDRHNSLTDPRQDPGSRDLVSTVCTEMLNNTNLLHQELRSLKIQINSACDTTPDVVPADLIEDPDKQRMSILRKTLLALMAAGVVGSVAWYYKSR
nr:ankyrin repeat, SAM and basic leucine zipper domain-containing protein 1-like [Lytechinus pictus]